MKNQQGFSLIELMVVMALSLVILGGVYFMIMHFGQSAQTENARITLQQESRFMLSSFSSEVKNAGSIISISNSGSFLSATSHFNGIVPLNNTDFPDGIILASGDPVAVTKLTQSFDASSALTLNVENTTVYTGDAADDWKSGDRGIVVGTGGYYIFRVDKDTPPSTTTITIRPQAVYYSGLLNVYKYSDTEATKGNVLTFPIDAPVIRLASFSIYYFRQIYSPEQGRNLRQLIRITDSLGSADPVGDNNASGWGVVSENIWDLQLAYAAFPNFPDTSGKLTYFSPGSTGMLSDLISQLQLKTVREITVSLVALTDEFGGIGQAANQVPAIGDGSAYTLPAGKYRYKLIQFNVEPKNFNVSI